MRANICHVIMTIFITYLALFLLDKCNLFSFISFIPEDKLFDVALPIYISFIEAIFRFLLTLLRARESAATITFFCRGNSPMLNVNPIILFNKENLAEIRLSIKLSGRKEAFQGKKIKIPAVDFASMQMGQKNKYIILNTDGSLEIDLQSLFGEADKTSESSVSASIAFIQEQYYDNREIVINPQFIGKRFYWFGYVQYEHNQYRVQIKSR